MVDKKDRINLMIKINNNYYTDIEQVKALQNVIDELEIKYVKNKHEVDNLLVKHFNLIKR